MSVVLDHRMHGTVGKAAKRQLGIDDPGHCHVTCFRVRRGEGGREKSREKRAVLGWEGTVSNPKRGGFQLKPFVSRSPPPLPSLSPLLPSSPRHLPLQPPSPAYHSILDVPIHPDQTILFPIQPLVAQNVSCDVFETRDTPDTSDQPLSPCPFDSPTDLPRLL